jgi:Uma2 family endonuclease
MEIDNENEVKEPAPKYEYISPEKFLRIARGSLEKLEYFNGYIEVKAAATRRHAIINGNLFGNTFQFLKGKPCNPFISDLMVVSPGKTSYTVPDMTIVCGDPVMGDRQEDILTNPVVIVEILSKSTGKYDMGHKFLYYKEIPSLKEYVLIDSKKRWARILKKQIDGTWEKVEYLEANAEIYIESIDFYISFETIYSNTKL